MASEDDADVGGEAAAPPALDQEFGPNVRPHHAELLRGSAIAPAVAAARGYRSVSRAEASAFGRKRNRLIT